MSSLTLPDVSLTDTAATPGALQWVGMQGIDLPLSLAPDQVQVHARADVQVDLPDPAIKGIHMSRLYLILDEHSSNRPLTVAGLKLLLSSLLESHRGLSTSAFIQFDFDYYVRRSALVSENAGWNSYPVSLKGTYVNGEVNVELSLGVLYSSTCPCSAALARQLIQQQFEKDFGRLGDVKMSEVKAWLGTEDGIMATPHSQRSLARVLVKLDDSMESFPITDLIDGVEDVLKTPVQTAVKREDEREFARLNGENLMFCEDAGRKLKTSLESDQRVKDFWVRVEHHESLHAHNAVSVFTKGVEKGYLPIP